MKYKPGDKVKVKSIKWYNDNKDDNDFIYCYNVRFVPLMSAYCDCILTIKTSDQGFYHVEENSWVWSDGMFEGLAEETIQPVIFKNIVFSNENYSDKVELCLGDDYEIVIEDGKTFVQKKKPKYPTTYEECCKVMGIDVSGLVDIFDNILDTPEIIYRKNFDRLIHSFRKLLICRDAYWKVAGEQIELGKSWEPDWNTKELKYIIYYENDKLWFNDEISRNTILTFPTEEMRDAFYENFKELIEKCKELL